ncbi:hypothetical protein ACHAXS_012534 [Conticribra weissflogii]
MLREYSTTMAWKPRQIPKYGILLSRQYFAASTFPLNPLLQRKSFVVFLFSAIFFVKLLVEMSSFNPNEFKFSFHSHTCVLNDSKQRRKISNNTWHEMGPR